MFKDDQNDLRSHIFPSRKPLTVSCNQASPRTVLAYMPNPIQDPAAATPEPALAPAQAPPAPVSVTVLGPDGKPLALTLPASADQVQALLAQREELAGQLTNVSERRSSLAAELSETRDPAARTGLEQRLALLDQRILQIETDLATTGRQISSAPAELVSLAEHQDHSSNEGHFEEGFFVGGFSALGVAAVLFFFVRRRWKRRAARVTAQVGGDSAPRLERLEHGMDAIALEIERISEGQRFVTRLLSESQSPFGQSQRLNKPLAAERDDPAKR
jgi:hypothetical protein